MDRRVDPRELLGHRESHPVVRRRAVNFRSSGLSSDLAFVTTNGAVIDVGFDGTIMYAVGAFTTVTDKNGTYAIPGAARLDLTTGLWDLIWQPVPNGGAAEIFAVQINASSVWLGGSYNAINTGYPGARSVNGLAKVDKITGADDAGFSSAALASAAFGQYCFSACLDGSSLYIAGSHITGVKKIDATTGAQDMAFATTIIDKQYFVNRIGADVAITGPYSTPRKAAGLYDPATGAVRSWDAQLGGPTSQGQRIYLQGSHYFVVGNITTAAGGTTRNGAASFDASGALQAWNPNVDVTSGVVRTMFVDASWAYLAGNHGGFGGVGAKPRFGRVNLTTGVVDSTYPGVTAGSPDYLCVNKDPVSGAIIVGGYGTGVTIGGKVRNFLVFIDSAGNVI